MTEEAVYYRFEDFLEGSGGYDIHGEWEPGPSSLRVQVVTFPVIKKTPKGAWIRVGGVGRQLVLDHWHRKFANPTLEGARRDFIARKRRLISIQEARIRDAKIAIATAERNEFEDRGLLSELRYLKRVHAWELSL